MALAVLLTVSAAGYCKDTKLVASLLSPRAAELHAFYLSNIYWVTVNR